VIVNVPRDLRTRQISRPASGRITSPFLADRPYP
jgi:hypothetical protein